MEINEYKTMDSDGLTDDKLSKYETTADAYRAGYDAGVADTLAKLKRPLEGRKSKAAVGGYSGGRYPYGYMVDKGELVINEEEAMAVREVFRRLEQGDTWQQIADALNLMKYPTRFGGEWTKSQIQSIKNNKKTYEGYYKYSDGDWVRGMQEPILR